MGQKANIRIVPLPGREFHGKVTNIGGTTGPPWNRRFECKMSLDDPAPELRPGLSARIVVSTDNLKDVLWLPAQALFESDGRKQVYLRQSSGGFLAKDIELVRRSESQIVIKGLSEGEPVALTNPTDRGAAPGSGSTKNGGPMKAIAK